VAGKRSPEEFLFLRSREEKEKRPSSRQSVSYKNSGDVFQEREKDSKGRGRQRPEDIGGEEDYPTMMEGGGLIPGIVGGEHHAEKKGGHAYLPARPLNVISEAFRRSRCIGMREKKIATAGR